MSLHVRPYSAEYEKREIEMKQRGKKIKGRIVFFKDIMKVSTDNQCKDALNGVLFRDISITES